MDELLETPFQIDGVKLLKGKEVIAVGFLKFQATVLLFHDRDTKHELWIEYMTVQSVSKKKISDKSGYALELFCKDFRKTVFVIGNEERCKSVLEHIEMLSLPDRIDAVDAFRAQPILNETVNGWDIYSADEEYMRMGVPCANWKRTDLNNKYEMCPTYCRKLFVPRDISDGALERSAKFRSKGRLPVLSYRDKETECCICRCSQPYSGVQGKRSDDDETLLRAIGACNPKSRHHNDDDGTELIIIDTRPKVNALANKAGGKGFENIEGYEHCRLEFHGIQNIHVMRDSLNNMLNVCSSDVSTTKFIKGLIDSAWLKHIQTVLITTRNIVRYFKQGHNILVHCSDGWDRTAQTCSLSGLILDPFYRTIRGYIVLIEKEWISYGHKFMDRHGFIKGSMKETSPVFLQFLECTWNLMCQFPTAFEFNEHFLITIHDCLHSCKFGTFLGNCDRERDEAAVKKKTRSVWTFIYTRLSDFMNPLYDVEGSPTVTFPDTSPQRFKLWTNMYCRWDMECLPKQSFTAAQGHLHSHVEEEERILDALKEKLSKLKRGESGDDVVVPQRSVKEFDYKLRKEPQSFLESW
eukprot:m.166206 g.166206  ORF g.166206 m.166206 type:complete len:580 (-) comp13444_c1_seq8:1724-3463(-)